jgi:hypothetical protein
VSSEADAPSGPDDPTAQGAGVGWDLEVLLSSPSVVAGSAVTARCVVTRHGEPVAGTAISVDVTPPAAVLAGETATFVVSPTVAATYVVTCRTTDGVSTLAASAQLDVTAAAPAVVHTALEGGAVQATVLPMESVRVLCRVGDAYDNEVTGVETSFSVLTEDGAGAEATGLTLSEAPSWPPPSSQSRARRPPRSSTGALRLSIRTLCSAGLRIQPSLAWHSATSPVWWMCRPTAPSEPF